MNNTAWMALEVFGTSKDNFVTITWGSPDFNNDNIARFKVEAGKEWVKQVELGENSEFEIQTEETDKNPNTGYILALRIKKPGQQSELALQCKFKAPIDRGENLPRATAVMTYGVCGITRTSRMNKTGEQNFRIRMSGSTKGEI